MLARLAKPVAALALAAALIAIVLFALGASPLAVFAALCEGAFGNWLAATDTLVKTTPLVFTGLAVSIAFRGALWNIGAEGQLLVGALAAGALGIALDGWPRPLAVGLVLVAGEPDAGGIPLLADRPLVDGRSAAYVCRGFVCDRPTTDPAELRRQLQAANI